MFCGCAAADALVNDWRSAVFPLGLPKIAPVASSSKRTTSVSHSN